MSTTYDDRVVSPLVWGLLGTSRHTGSGGGGMALFLWPFTVT